MKSLPWGSNFPDMKGKKSNRYADDSLWNFREEYNEKFDWQLARMEMPELVWDPIYDVWFDWDDHYDT